MKFLSHWITLFEVSKVSCVNNTSLLLVISIFAFLPRVAFSQSTSNVTNNAAPTANVSTNANGGTQINQQLNNVFDTSFGFGPGIICKTPEILINAAAGNNNSYLDILDSNSGNNQNSQNFTGSLTLAVPIGSSVIQDCQKFAAQIAKDRVLSSELSLIRACAQLEKEKLAIDPTKYPNLAKCLPTSFPNTKTSFLPPSQPAASTFVPATTSTTAPSSVLQRFNP